MSEKVTPETLALWKRLADEATPLPWVPELHHYESKRDITNGIYGQGRVFICEDVGISDANFVAAARTAVPALIEAYEKLQADLEFANDVVKERESWAAMRLQTCKKLEDENDRLRKQLEKCKEQRNDRDKCIGGKTDRELDAEIEAIK